MCAFTFARSFHSIRKIRFIWNARPYKMSLQMTKMILFSLLVCCSLLRAFTIYGFCAGKHWIFHSSSTLHFGAKIRLALGKAQEQSGKRVNGAGERKVYAPQNGWDKQIGEKFTRNIICGAGCFSYHLIVALCFERERITTTMNFPPKCENGKATLLGGSHTIFPALKWIEIDANGSDYFVSKLCNTTMIM